MAEVADAGTRHATRTKSKAFVVDGADARLQAELAERAERRARSATWKSSLGGEDLSCLMTVIESQLLPRLLRNYRPADRSPLSADTRP